jgi:hypothetical protein
MIAELLACRLRLAGGKKGVDMAGMSDLGGVKFFNLACETPNGDLALMDALLEGGCLAAADVLQAASTVYKELPPVRGTPAIHSWDSRMLGCQAS